MLNNFVPNLVDLLLSRFHFKDHNIELEKKERKNKKNKQTTTTAGKPRNERTKPLSCSSKTKELINQGLELIF